MRGEAGISLTLRRQAWPGQGRRVSWLLGDFTEKLAARTPDSWNLASKGLCFAWI